MYVGLLTLDYGISEVYEYSIKGTNCWDRRLLIAAGTRNSMQVDEEGRTGWNFLAIKMKARTALVHRGEKSASLVVLEHGFYYYKGFAADAARSIKRTQNLDRGRQC